MVSPPDPGTGPDAHPEPPPAKNARRGSSAPPSWTFLTNHGHVLLAVASEPDTRVADLARLVGVTPRAALSILKDLETAGYLRRTRVGRRTHYTIEPHRHFRHPAAAAREVDGLIALFTGSPPQAPGEPAQPGGPGGSEDHGGPGGPGGGRRAH